MARSGVNWRSCRAWWSRKQEATPPHSPGSPRRYYRPQIEPLEHRQLLSVGPQVSGSSLAEGQVLAPGPWDFTAIFDRPLSSETVDSADVMLVGQRSGLLVVAPGDFAYDEATQAISLGYADLQEDCYTLVLRSGSGAFQGTDGSALDGDADGAAGGHFVVHFSVDACGPDSPGAFHEPLWAESPAGSQIYDSAVSAAIGAGDDVDAYTVDLDGGQAVTVVVQPSAGLRPAVRLLDPAGEEIAAVAAAQPGMPAALALAPVAVDGTYLVVISSADEGEAPWTSGTYTAQLALNATGEEEGGAQVALNNGPDTAQDLASAFFSLRDADRAAVIGRLESVPGDVTEWNAAEWAVTASDGAWSMLSNDPTHVRFGQASLRVDTLSGFDVAAVLPGARNAHVNLAADGAIGVSFYAENSNLGFQEGSPWIRLVDQEGDYVELHAVSEDLLNAANGQWVDYQIPLGGDAMWIRSESIASGDGAVNLADIGSVEIHADTWDSGFSLWVDGLSLPIVADTEDWYRFSLDDAQSATLVLSSSTEGNGGSLPAGVGLELYDRDGQLLTRGSAAANFDTGIHRFTDRTSDGVAEEYYVRVTGENAGYRLLTLRGADFEREGNGTVTQSQHLAGATVVMGAVTEASSPAPVLTAEIEPNNAGPISDPANPAEIVRHFLWANDLMSTLEQPSSWHWVQLGGQISEGGDQDWDFYRINASPGDGLSTSQWGYPTSPLGLLPWVDLRLYDHGGNLLAESHAEGGTGLWYGEFAYAGDYYIVADAYPNAEGKETGDYQLYAELYSPQLLSSPDVDVYRVETDGTVPLTIDVEVPSAGPHQFDNGLVPKIDVYDPSGTKLAPTEDGTYQPASAGTCVVVIGGQDSSRGEYVLSVDGGEAVDEPFAVAFSEPADLAPSNATTLTVRWNDEIWLPSLSAADLLVDGVPSAGSVTVADGRTLVFTLPALDEGPHDLEIPGAALEDVQGTASSAWAIQFTVDRTGPRVVAASIEEDAALTEVGELAVQFDEALRSADLDFGDAVLVGQRTGAGEVWFGFDPETNSIYGSMSAYAEDLYTLTLTSGAGAFEDVAGNALDGERTPAAPLPSGDGSAGGDFVLHFSIDGQEPRPLEFVTDHPLGGLVWEYAAAAAIGPHGWDTTDPDQDVFAMTLEAGHTLSVVVVPDATLAPTVMLRQTGGDVVATATASQPGEEAIFEFQPVAEEGDYEIVVTGADGTIGTYSIRVAVDTGFENEMFGEPANDTLDAAESIAGPDFLDLGAGVSRAAVLGSIRSSASVSVSDGAVHGASVESIVDGVFLPRGTAWQQDTVWWTSEDGTPALVLDFGQVRTLTGGKVQADNNDEYRLDYWDDSDGAWKPLWTVENYGAMGIGGVLTRPDWPTTDVAETFQFPAAVSTSKVRILAVAGDGMYSVSEVLLQGAEGTDVYKFSLDAGQSASLALAAISSGGGVSASAGSGEAGAGAVTMQVLDAEGNLLARGASGYTYLAEALNRLAAPSDHAADYYVVVQGSADYSLVLARNAAIELEPNDSSEQAQPLGPAETILAYSNWDNDWYSLAVQAEDHLQIWIDRPSLAAGQPDNTLPEPNLELIAPDGSSAAAGQSLDLVAAEAGTYRLCVSVGGWGPHLVHVAGASGTRWFTVRAAVPADGAVLTEPSTVYQIDLSEAVLVDSVQADDLVLSTPAGERTPASVGWIDGDTLVFRFDGEGLLDGAYQAHIAGGAMTGVSGAALEEFRAGFAVDAIAPSVLSGPVGEGAVIGAGDVQFEVLFSERLEPTVLGPEDIGLTGLAGSPIWPSEFSYDPDDPDGPTVRFGFDDLVEGNYTLRLISSSWAFCDLAGRPLDGDGDGIEGGDLVRHFTVKAPPQPLSTPLVAVVPLGSLVYDPLEVGWLSGVGDVDPLTIALDAGQVVSVRLTPRDPSIRVRLQLLDSEANPVAAAVEATEAGQTVLLQAVPVTAAGTYTIVATNLEGSGEYELRLYANAVLEAEDWGQGNNDTLAAAQAIDASAVAIAGSADRLAVLGMTDIAAPDYYAFELAEGQYATLVLATGAGSGAELELRSESDQRLAAGAAAANVDGAIRTFRAPEAGTYYARVAGTAGTEYTLVVTRGATFDLEPNSGMGASAQALTATGVALGCIEGHAIATETEPNDSVAQANDWTGSFASLGGTSYRAVVTGNVTPSYGRDYFKIVVTHGDSLTLNLEGSPTGKGTLGDSYLYLYDEAGSYLAADDDSGVGANSYLAWSSFPWASGNYYVAAGGYGSSTGTYTLTADLTTSTFRSSSGEDDYAVSVQAGDALLIQTSTPLGGPDEPVNALDPLLVLYDEHGVEVARNDNGPDGRNSRIEYTVPAGSSGMYTVSVRGTEGVGEYALEVTGASGAPAAFHVQATAPIDGALLSGYPAAFRIDFSAGILLTSVSPADLTVTKGGVSVPATSVAVIDGDTLEFAIAAAEAGDGLYTLDIAAGAIRSLAGSSLEAFTATFNLDTTAPTVLSTTPAEAASLAAGAVQIRVVFSEELITAGLGAEDVSLVGAVGGPVAAGTFTYANADGQSIATITFDALPEDNYTLTLDAASFADLRGNSLDGDGDGVAGDDFVLHFHVDNTTTALATLVAVVPDGSLIYRTSTSGVFNVAGDVDAFTIALDAGQTASLLLAPQDAAIRAKLEWLDPDSNVVATVIASQPGDVVLLQTQPVATAGLYTVRATGLAGVGSYHLELLANAAAETESWNGSSNNAIASAQSLEPSAVTLADGADRLAVVGNIAASTADYFAFQLAEGEYATLVLEASAGSAAGLELRDSADQPLATGVVVGSSLTRSINEFRAAATGTYYARIAGAADAEYTLAVTRGAAFGLHTNFGPGAAIQDITATGMVLGATGIAPIATETEPNDSVAQANDWTGSFASLGGNSYRAVVTGNVTPSYARDFFKIVVTHGDSLILNLEGGSTGKGSLGDSYLYLYNEAGTILASDDDAGVGTNSYLGWGSFPWASGNYYVAAAGYSSHTGTYTLTADLETLSPPRGAEEFAVSVQPGDALLIQTSTPLGGPDEPVNALDPLLVLYDEHGAEVARNDNGPDGRNSRIEYTVPAGSSGSYTIRVTTAGSAGEYVLQAAGYTGDPAPFQVRATDPADGAILATALTTYRVDFSAGILLDSITASDLTVTAGSETIAAEDVTIVDGDTLAFTVASAVTGDGVYTVHIAAGALTSVSGQALAPFSATFTVDRASPSVVASSIAEGGVVPPGTVGYTVTFSEELATAGLGAEDVVLQAADGTHTPSSFVYNPDTHALTVAFAGVPEGTCSLTLRSAPDGFRDRVGNLLDGDSSFPLPSGDGTAGGDFVVHFATDRPTSPFPTPLAAVAPGGSLVFGGSQSGVFADIGLEDSDSFTLDLDAGQTITVLLDSMGTIHERWLEVFAPDGTSLGRVDDPVVQLTRILSLQNVPVAVAGTYRIEVGAAFDEDSTFALGVVLNAGWEDESLGGSDNGSLAHAVPLDGAWLTLPGGGQRAAILGVAVSDDDVDWYRVDLAAGQHLTAAATGLEGGSAGLRLLDSAGTLLTLGVPSGSAPGQTVRDFVSTAGGTYYVRVAGEGKYSLVVTRDLLLSDLGVATYATDFESGAGPEWSSDITDNAVPATFTRFLGRFGNQSGWPSSTTLSVPTIPGRAYVLQFDLDVIDSWDGGSSDWFNVFADGQRLFHETFSQFGGSQTYPHSPDVQGSYGWSGWAESIYRSIRVPMVASATTTLIQFAGEGLQDLSDESWGLDNVRVLDASPDITAVGWVLAGYEGTADAYSFAAAAGDTIDLCTATPLDGSGQPDNAFNPALELINPDGLSVAVNMDGAADGKNAHVVYTVPAGEGGVYYVHVSGTGLGAYTLALSGSTAIAPVPPEVVAVVPASGSLLAANPATLEFSISEGILLGSLDAVDLSFTESGATVSGAEMLDGRRIRFTVNVPDVEGTYHYALAADALTDLQGETSLPYSGSFTIDHHGPYVVGQAPDIQTSAPLGQWTFTFSESLAFGSVTTADVTAFTGPGGADLLGAITGVSVSGATVTVTFQGQTNQGIYTLTLGPAVTDLAGNPMDQDGDGANGEGTDAYTATIEVTSADLDVVSVVPQTPLVFDRNVTVNWTIQNVGNDPARLQWSDSLYLSKDPTLDGGDYFLGTFPRPTFTPDRLAAGGEYTGTATVHLPLSLAWPAGSYYFLVRADSALEQPESDETNNDGASAAVNIVLPTLPNLVVSGITAPASAISGNAITFSWTLTNSGSGPATGTWWDRVWLTAQANGGGASLHVGDYQFSGTIAAGDSVTLTKSYTLPEKFSGDWYFAVVADLYDQVEEYDRENDNTSVDDQSIHIDLRPFPNLVIDSITPPVGGFSSQQIEVRWTVRNTGNGATPGGAGWYDSVWLSPDEILNTDTDVLLGSWLNPDALAAGASYANTQTSAALPRGISGTYYLIVKTDSAHWIDEYTLASPNPNEADNVRVSAAFPVVLTPPPDLQVTAVTAPNFAFSNQAVTVRWDVANAGSGATMETAWQDQVWLWNGLSGADSRRRLLGTFGHVGTMAPNGQYTGQGTVTIPQDILGAPYDDSDNYYFLVVTDSAAQVYEHAYEANNETAAARATFVSLLAPDLRVENIEVPADAYSSQSAVVRWEIANRGTGPTGQSAWNDQVWLSRNGQLDGDDVLLGTVGHNHALGAGESQAMQATVTIPASIIGGVEGPYYFLIRTDSAAQVYERFGNPDVGESNNTEPAATETNVHLQPPDLRVSAVDAPANAWSGHDIAVGYVVINDGTATPNATWTDAFYLSSDAVFDPASDVLLGTRSRQGALAAGASYGQTATLRLPNTLPTGDYYVFAKADSANVVYELDEVDNAARDLQAVHVVWNPADLAVPTATAPTIAQAGSSLLATWTVANVASPAAGGGDTVSDTWKCKVYASTDMTRGNADDLLLATFTRTGALDAGTSYVARDKLIPIPVTLSGQIYLWIRTDADISGVRPFGEVYESNEANNDSDLLPVLIVQNLADLQVSAVTPVPGSANAGQAVTVQWEVSNAGGGKTNANSWHDAIYLSTDATITTGDQLLKFVSHGSALEAGDSYTGSTTITLPAGLLTQTYYVGVLTDRYNAVFEGAAGEGNNSGGAPINVTALPITAPDLSVSSVEAPAEAISGQAFSLTWTVANGGDSTTASWYDAAYLSLDQVLDNSDTYLGYEWHHGLTQDGEYSVTRSFTIPRGLYGTFYVMVLADHGGYVTESGELNNLGRDATQMLVTIAPPADLVVGTITVPANAQPGQNATLGYTVVNQGDDAARGSWYDSLYISADATWDLADALFGRVYHGGDVAGGGGSYSAALTAPLPGVLPGDYHVIVRSDIRNHVPESNEANNIGGSLDTVDVDAELLLDATVTPAVDGADSDALTQGRSVYYRMELPAGETVRLFFDGADDAYSELYVRRGAMPSRSQYDFAASQPFVSDQEIVLPAEQAGTYYVMAYATSAPGSRNYTITAETIPFGVRDVEADTVGNFGPVTLKISGARFTQTTQLELITEVGGQTYHLDPDRLWIRDSATAFATFDLNGTAPGLYGIRAVDGELTNELADALTVVQGDGAAILATVDGVNNLRPYCNYAFTLNWVNDGDGDAMAPLLLVENEKGIPIGFNSGDLRGTSLQVLGVAEEGFLDVLRPDDPNSTSLLFQTLGATTDPGGGVRLRIVPYTDQDQELLSDADWAGIEAAVRPAALSDAQWAPFWANIQPRIGTSWGDYVRFLNRMETTLAVCGQPIRDVRAMFLALYDQNPEFRASSRLSGRLLDLEDGTPQAGVLVMAYQAVNGVLTRAGSATTGSDGSFTMSYLLPGTYELAAEDLTWDVDRDGIADIAPPSVTVLMSADTDAGTLYAGQITVESFGAIDSDPVLAVDSAGVAHMIWNRAGTVWHAYYQDGLWIGAQAISSASGTSLKLQAAANLFGAGAAGLIASWTQGAGNQAEVYYAAGRARATGGYQWSAPQPLTADELADAGPALAVDPATGKALLVYLKSDQSADVQDDTDLYYAFFAVDPSLLPVGALGSGVQAAAQTSGFSYEKKLTDPFFGSEFTGSIAGEVELDGCELTATVTGSAEWEINDRWSVSGSLSGAGKWKADRDRCEWDFNGAEVSVAVGGTYDWQGGLVWVLKRIPIPQVQAAAYGLEALEAAVNVFSFGQVELSDGIEISGEISGTAEWSFQAPFPAWVLPDSGSISLTIGLSPYIKAECEADEVEVKVYGKLEGEIQLIPSLKLEKIVGAVGYEAKLGPFTFGPEEYSVDFYKSDDAAGRLYGQGGSTLVWHYDPAATQGSGADYSNGSQSAVLATVGSDLWHDSPAALAVDGSGTAFAAWNKDQDPAVALGGSVVVSDFAGGGWSAPVELPNSLGINDGVVAGVDGAGHRVVVWAKADASALHREDMTVEEISAARRATDVFYSVFDGAAWTTHRLADLPGADSGLSIARDGNSLVVGWLHETASGQYQVLVASWDGTQWSVPEVAYAGANLADVAVSRLGTAGPLAVFFSQSTDGAVGGRGIQYSALVGGHWTAAQPFAPVAAATPGAKGGVGALGQPEVLGILVPDDCCKCQQWNVEFVGVDQGCGSHIEIDADHCRRIVVYDPCVVRPRDPNDIIGPKGYGSTDEYVEDYGWVTADQTYGYTIHFENAADASGPAQQVIVTQKLDSDLDISTFRVGELGFNHQVFPGPVNAAFYHTVLDLTEDYGYLVELTVMPNAATNEIQWTITTLDPDTGMMPADASLGFLPVNADTDGDGKGDTGDGEGFLTYTIRAKRKAQLANGTRVDAVASIVFDNQPPLDTPPIYNTIDKLNPVSAVDELPAISLDPVFHVTWAGGDEDGGSGFRGFDVLVSADGGTPQLWLTNTQLTEADYVGQAGHEYAFYVTARDNAGNREALPASPDAQVAVGIPNQPPIADAGGPYTVAEGGSVLLDASATTDSNLPDDALTYAWDLDGDGVFGETGAAALRGDEVGVQPTFSAAGLGGPASWTVALRVTDQGDLTSSTTTTIDLTNVAPTAVADAYSVAEDGVLSAPLPGVLGNDTDPGADALAAVRVSGPSHGELALDANGSFVYTPAADYHGPDSFSYRVNDGLADSNVVTVSLTVTPVADLTGRYLFYNNSAWDGDDEHANAQDYNAIAPAPSVLGHGHADEMNELDKQLGKQALLSGQTATFVNYSSYAKGINGIIIAFDDLADPNGLALSDFVFRAGNSDAPAEWPLAPAPAWIRVDVDVTHPAFAGHPDVVTIVWADENPYTAVREPGAISNQWLQVTVLAAGHTGLSAAEVFYWGNQIGEAGNSATDTNVDQNDEIGARNHPHTAFNAASLADPYDYNRDGKVDQNDEILTRNNPATAFNRLQLLAAPANGPSASGSRAAALPLLAADPLPSRESGLASVDFSAPAIRLTSDVLLPVVAEARARWESAGLDDAQRRRLQQAEFAISDLGGRTLGLADPAADRVLLDDDAAGLGWFIDPTPAVDEEFASSGRSVDGPAAGQMDALTAVMHEMGHLLGLADLDAAADELMASHLASGVRRAVGGNTSGATMNWLRPTT